MVGPGHREQLHQIAGASLRPRVGREQDAVDADREGPSSLTWTSCIAVSLAGTGAGRNCGSKLDR